MLHGDVVTFLRGGIQLRAKAMLPIGIFDKSVCWGVWVRDASPTDANQTSHLVVSSLHPRYWPYLLRFELKLKDSVGAMRGAAKALHDKRLNILSGQSCPSGHHHATWNVICEAVDVRRDFEPDMTEFQRRQSSRTTVCISEINELATRIATRMYGIAAEVREEMENQRDFLHPRVLSGEPKLLHVAEAIGNDESLGLRVGAGDLARSDREQAVRVRWIQNLPVFALYGLNTLDPYVFSYSRSRSMLRPVRKDAFATIAEKGEIEVPTKAIASIYPEEHHVRLIPIRSREQLKQWVQIDFNYDAKLSGSRTEPAGEGDGDTTIGVWADVCGTLTDLRINLQRVTNKTVHHEPNSEEGTLTLIGHRDGPVRQQDLKLLKHDLSNLRTVAGRHITPRVKPNRMACGRVFISRRMNSHEGNHLVAIARERARFWGFEPVMVTSPVGQTLTQVVTRRIRQCAAFFQIVTVSQDEFRQMQMDRTGKVIPALHWLWYEYGVAAGHGLPVARIVDESVMPLEEWKQQLRIGADDTLATFSLREFTRLKKRFDFAMWKLAERVHGASTDG